MLTAEFKGNIALVVLAAGIGSRFGGLKQIAPVDDDGRAIIDYSVYDAARAGFQTVVFVINPSQEEAFRRGIGHRLMQAVATRLFERGRRSFYLWVLDQNVAAQRFYTAQGGRRVETRLRGPFPGGGFALGHRIAWIDALELIHADTKKSS